MTMKKIAFALSIFFVLNIEAQEFISEDVSLGELKGTLSLPKKKTKTAILMISGSGPTDRNGNSAMGLSNNSLKMVAESFTEAGFAVLRFDKRGIAESAAAVDDPSALRFDHFIEDTKSWLSFLDEKGFKDLIVAGHSQGSLVGMIAAQNDNRVKGFISISGIADEVGYTMVKQLQLQAPVLVELASAALDSMREGYTVNSPHPMLASLFGPQIQDFLKSYMAYTPSEEIKKLVIPALIVNGTTDLQVSVDDAKKLNESYSNSTLLIIEGMNHVLKDAPKDDMVANAGTYNNPDLPLSEGLMNGMITFIKKL